MTTMWSRRFRLLILISTTILTAAVTPTVEERLEQARNLGKAFYENPTTANESVAEFKKALDLAPNSNREKLNYALALLRAGKANLAVPILKDVQSRDPRLPHTWFNLGVYYRKNGEPDQAVVQFEAMLKLTPEEPIAHYQLGALDRQQGKLDEAIAQFEDAIRLNPNLAAAHFQLYNLYRQAAKTDEATEQLQIFQALKKAQEGAAIAEDVDWCNYAEIYDPPRPVSPETKPVYDDKALPLKAEGIATIDSTGKGDIDLIAWSAAGASLYHQGAMAPLTDLKGIVDIASGDFDNDGLLDLCILTESGPKLYRNTGGKFAAFAADLPGRRFDRAIWVDYDHDYDLDLLLLGQQPALLRNQGGAGFADRTSDFPFANGSVTDAFKLRVVPDSKAFDIAVFYSGRAPVIYRDRLAGHYEAAAWDGPGRDRNQVEMGADLARIANDGVVHLLRNKSQTHWIRIQLTGVKSLKTGQDAEIEIKAGRLYRKHMYEGVPLTFDLGAYTSADAVRITWMNGLIQNETKQAANKAYKYEEQQRLSGSCPMIWTWNGHEFQFITDVLGVAPLGASDGDGTFFPVDHDEYVSIPAKALVPVNGGYEIRVTEELSEVSYLDQIQLYAIDHPVDTTIYTNEKFKSPPYPEFRLFGVKRRIYPKTPPVNQFQRTSLGVAEMHNFDLDFGNAAPSGRATLLLHGWVDWPDGSTFRAASQESKAGLVMPSLQMQDAQGRWQTVNPDMGMPAGKPKTIAVDVKFISASRKLRIVTNLCVYWDDIFLSEDAGAPTVTQTMAKLESAELHFRGFSESRIDAERKQPDTYFYGHVFPTSFWNPTPGLYTRYGDVRELSTDVDDRLIVMGSGDELKLRFAALPPVRAGWARDFLLKVDGWAKDRDPNTAFATTVDPLPFHGMSVYPYPQNEHFPDDPVHERYRREYNTRPALRLIRPLAPPPSDARPLSRSGNPEPVRWATR